MDAAWAALPLARAALEIGRGDLDAAEARLHTVRRLLPVPIPAAQKAGPLFAGLAEIALWRRDLKQAKDLVAEAVPLVEANPRYAAPLYALGVRIEADRADLARARHGGQPGPDDGTATALLNRLDRAAAGPAGASLPTLAAWQATAFAERTRQRGHSDPVAWATAADVWERLGQPYRLAYARFREAEALLASRDHHDPATAATAATAATVLAAAADLVRRIGAQPLQTEIEALARRGRLDIGPRVPADAPTKDTRSPAERIGLTPREAQVLALVAAGHSNRQIAQALFISPKTASVHISNILAKLGASTRIEAAAIAHRLGLDQPPPPAT
jgi:DNA-binding CsgD family transcriptional regulator